MAIQARAAILAAIFDKAGMDMNRVMVLENLLALAAIAVFGPGTSVLVREAASQAMTHCASAMEKWLTAGDAWPSRSRLC